MKKIVDDIRLIYKVCSLYYEDDMNQKQIGEYLGVSRSSVVRMLQKGKQQGIVQIQLHNPASYNYGELEKRLETKYGMKDVIIVENSVLDSKSEAISQLFGKAAEFLADFFKEGDCIGVSMGHTLNNVVQTNRTFPRKENLMFVPMVGGISRSTVDGIDVQSNAIARQFSEKFGGTYTQFLSPAVFSDKTVMEFFLQEKAVNFIFDEFQKINVMVVGIGIPERADHTLIKAGYAQKDELDRLSEAGAVGDICLKFFDENGKTENFCFFNDRVAAMAFRMMKKVPNRIGIASGEKKVTAVKGAIRGGFINILITNAEMAEKLVEE